MTANTKDDADLKVKLIDDVMTILDFEKILEGENNQIGGFDLVYKGTPVTLPIQHVYSTYLGCENNREENLKKLGKSISLKLNNQHKIEEEKEIIKKVTKKKKDQLKTIEDV